MKLLAQAPTWTATWGDGNDPVATIGSLSSLFTNLLRSVMALAGVILFIVLVMGGFTFLFSGGDQKKLEKAKGTITHALIGLTVLIGSYLILLLIKSITGVDVTTFQLNIGE